MRDYKWAENLKSLTVATSEYAGNWWRVALQGYEAAGVKVVKVRYTLTAEEIGLPADTDMKDVKPENPALWGRIDWDMLKHNKVELIKAAVEQMKTVDMLYLAGNSYEYYSADDFGREIYTKPKGEMAMKPEKRADPRCFSFRREVEEEMIKMAQQRWLPFWGVCAAHQYIALREGAELHPFVQTHMSDKGIEPALHKIDIPNPNGGKPIGYGDIEGNTARLVAFNDNRMMEAILRGQLNDPVELKSWRERASWIKNDRVLGEMKGNRLFMALNDPRVKSEIIAFHAMHQIKVEPGSILSHFYDGVGVDAERSIGVNSSHYQGINAETIDPKYVSARAPDGLPECLEMPDKYAFGVFPLFHPETGVCGTAGEYIDAATWFAGHLNERLGRDRQNVPLDQRVDFKDVIGQWSHQRGSYERAVSL